MADCTCPQSALSEFDQGMLDAFDSALAEMGDTVEVAGFTIPCVVLSRTVWIRNAQGGKVVEVSASVEIRKSDYPLVLSELGNGVQGKPLKFSDGVLGRISQVQDDASPMLTISVGARVVGATGPQGGQW